jgi:chromosome segregation ATPase
MNMIVDFILLAASGAAAVYCFVLSKRLKKLNDMKNGLGASIASMSQTLDQTQQVLALAKRSSVESIERLSALLEEAERLTPELSQLMDALGELSEIAADDIAKAKDEALDAFEEGVAAAIEDLEGAARAPLTPPRSRLSRRAA